MVDEGEKERVFIIVCLCVISIQRERGREGTLLEMLNQKPKEKNGKNERNLKKKS